MGRDILFATDELERLSQNVRELGPVGSYDARRWVAYWRSQGFFA